MTRLVIYSREDCHLCERAGELLQQAGVSAREVDIEDSVALLSRYASRIPVLADRESRRELAWPFDLEQLQKFLESVDED